MEREFLDITIEDVTPIMGVDVSIASPHLSVDVEDITPRLMVECEQVYEVEGDTVPHIALEYIESTGTQWIDTFVGGDNNNLRIDFECYIIGFTAYAGLFGNYTNETANCWRTIMTASSNSQLYANANMRGGFATTITAPIKTDLSICVEYDKITVNGKSYSTRKNVGSLNDNSICLFRQNSSSGGSKMRLYSFKIYDNNKIIRDFIPVLDRKDVPCLYDKVSGEYFYNQGTNNFLYELK